MPDNISDVAPRGLVPDFPGDSAAEQPIPISIREGGQLVVKAGQALCPGLGFEGLTLLEGFFDR